MLANSLTWLGVHSVFDQLFDQTVYVSYFTDTIYCSNGNEQVNKSRHYVLDIILDLLRGRSIKNQWIKSDTMC